MIEGENYVTCGEMVCVCVCVGWGLRGSETSQWVVRDQEESPVGSEAEVVACCWRRDLYAPQDYTTINNHTLKNIENWIDCSRHTK